MKLRSLLAAALIAGASTSAYASCPYKFDGGTTNRTECEQTLAEDIERADEANKWLAHLRAEAKTKQYLDTTEQFEMDQARDQARTRNAEVADDQAVLAGGYPKGVEHN